MNVTQQQLLTLLRAALWNSHTGAPLFRETADWRALFSLAEKQTVVALVYDVVITLPVNQQPDTGTLHTAHLQTVRTAQSHQLLNATLAEIVSRLHAQNIHAVLLKGQGVARNYPNALRRGCGDIDLYVGEPEYSRTCFLLNEWGMLEDPKRTESIQHLHFTYNSV
ncbi:MAG: nucleotidyltransferase family protein, partial [Bacteroides sp.]